MRTALHIILFHVELIAATNSLQYNVYIVPLNPWDPGNKKTLIYRGSRVSLWYSERRYFLTVVIKLMGERRYTDNDMDTKREKEEDVKDKVISIEIGQRNCTCWDWHYFLFQIFWGLACVAKWATLLKIVLPDLDVWALYCIWERAQLEGWQKEEERRREGKKRQRAPFLIIFLIRPLEKCPKCVLETPRLLMPSKIWNLDI